MTRQFGTLDGDFVAGIAVDPSGSVWIVGSTEGTLGDASSGDLDAFVMYYPSGETTPVVYQFGSDKSDAATAVAADSLGNVWIAGYTYGALSGSNLGQRDAFVRVHRVGGATPVTYQFGTGGMDTATSVSVDNEGNAWVAGETTGKLGAQQWGRGDGFLRLYPSDGSPPTTHQFGTTGHEFVSGIAIDEGGRLWLSGSTDGSFQSEANVGGTDAFLYTYVNNGAGPSIVQFGTSGSDYARAVTRDSFGSTWVLGETTDSLAGVNSNPGIEDVFLRRYEDTSVETRQFGTSTNEEGAALTNTPQAEIWIAGTTHGDLGGESAGSEDAFVAVFRSGEALPSTRQFGSDGQDRAKAIATDEFGNVWIGGYTSGSLSGLNRGDWDGFVRQVAR